LFRVRVPPVEVLRVKVLVTPSYQLISSPPILEEVVVLDAQRLLDRKSIAMKQIRYLRIDKERLPSFCDREA